MKNTRRSFLKNTALLAAPLILPAHLVTGANKPSERITLGMIGVGKQANVLFRGFIGNPNIQIVAVADVDTDRRNNGIKKVNDYYTQNPTRGTADCKGYKDFRKIIARKDIDAVLVTTPDHWHAFPTIEAMKAGKDVYCEKPLTHNIHESVEVMKVAKQTKRILQTGSMQRSMTGFRTVCEVVQNGVIGKVSHVDCQFGDPGRVCDLPEEEMQPGLDWKMWVGPRKMRPYNSILSPRGVHRHYPNWRHYKEFGGGMVCDWGAHHLDIAQWGLGMDKSGPVLALPPKDPNAKQGASLVYDNGITVNHKHGGYGIHFYGDKGEVMVNRGRFDLFLDGKKVAGYQRRRDRETSLNAQVKFVEKEFLKDAKIKLYRSPNHVMNFVDCVKSRKRPITDEIVGGRTAICCHLVNQTYYNGQKIEWNPKKNTFKPGTGDPKWLTEDYTSPWKV